MGGIIARVAFDEAAGSPAHLSCAPSCRAGCETPRPSPDGTYQIAFDGRLDNREDLRRALDVPPGSDAALVLAAFQAWDARAPQHLIGDFAFAIWDARRRRLFCARDPLGVRPLYYSSDSRRFCCASEIEQILALPDLVLEPNPGMIAEHLANAITSQDETVYARIMRLPHGHTLSVGADGTMTRERYWAIDSGRTLACRNDAEYAEQFDALFTEAVRCRLPSDGAAAVYLSGGIDSSAVTAVAGRLSAGRTSPEAFSLAFGDDPELDELRYIGDVCRHSGVRSHVARVHRGSAPDDRTRSSDVFDTLRDRAAFDWKREIRARGFRVALTGQGGDHGFYGSVYQYADLLRDGRVRAMVRQWRAGRRMPDSNVTVKDLMTAALWPLLPPHASRFLRPLARRVAGMHPVPRWMPAAFASSVNLQDRLRPARDKWTGGSAAAWDVRRNYESGWLYMSLEAAARVAASLDLDERHPFLDSRVVQFAAALPDEQRWRGELTRLVVRNALGDRLPPSVRSRTSAGDGSRRVADGVEAMARWGVFDGMRLAARGWIDQRVVTTMLRRMRERLASGDSRYTAEAFSLWIIGGTERWFRAAFESGYTCSHHRQVPVAIPLARSLHD